jgi:hypothetical protein
VECEGIFYNKKLIINFLCKKYNKGVFFDVSGIFFKKTVKKRYVLGKILAGQQKKGGQSGLAVDKLVYLGVRGFSS